MNKELSPLQIVLIVALFVALLLPIFWIQGKIAAVPRLSHMHSAPNGHLFVLLGSDLFEHDVAGVPVRRIDLTQYGVETVIGDFGFFSNGDLLIRRGADKRDLQFNLLKFLRIENFSSEQGQAEEGGLFRCQLDAFECQAFGSSPLNLNDAFYLEMDWAGDRVFLADTSRHRILMLDAGGRVIDEQEQRLKFPNQIRYADGELFVANTNYNEISAYRVAEDGLKRSAKGFSLYEKRLGKRHKVWPTAVLPLADQLWVISTESNMRRGAIQRFTHEGELLQRIESPREGDYFGMLPFGDAVLVNDIERGQLHRYSLAGERMDDLEPSPLLERLAELAREREGYRWQMYLFVGLFVAVLAIGFVIGLRQVFLDKDAETAASPRERAVTPHTPGIRWLETDPKIRRQFLWLAWIVGAVGVLQLVAMSALAGEMRTHMFALFVAVIVAMGLLFRYLLGLTRQRIGIFDDLVILVNGRGQHATGGAERVVYSGNHIAIGDMVLVLRTTVSFFVEADLIKHLYPLLVDSRNLNAREMQWRLIRRNPIWMALLGVALLGMFVLALVDIGGGL